MFKVFAQLAFAVVVLGVGLGAQAGQLEPLTKLPLYPGMEFASKDTQDVCGTHVQNATYSPAAVDLSTVDTWFAANLHGFKKIKGTTRNYPYDVFINADGTSSVSVLGSGPKRGVEVVVYHHNAKPASLSNLTNWLDGSDPLCH